MKQTAVEWLWKQYNNECDCGGDVEYTLAEKLFKQAKAMEKEQIIDAYLKDRRAKFDKVLRLIYNAQKYYTETYESNN